MMFPEKAGPRPLTVEGCSVRVATWTAMGVNLWHRHVRDTVVIPEEGNLPHPRCPLCNMLVSWRDLNGMHRRTVQCRKGAGRKRRRLTEEEERDITSRAFSAYELPLDMVTYFKYLGQVISAADNDWAKVVQGVVAVAEDYHQGVGGTSGIRIFI